MQHIADCPNVEPLLELLSEISETYGGFVVTTKLISSEREALDYGFCGSPTLLVDGVDHFSHNKDGISEACRIYYDQDKTL